MTEWLSAKTARLFVATNGSINTCHNDLVDWAISGQLTFRGLSAETNNVDEIPKVFWKHVIVGHIRWSSSQATANVPAPSDHDRPRKMTFYAIECKRQDLLAVMEPTSVPPSNALPTKNDPSSLARGARRKAVWDDWVASLAWLCVDGQVHGGLTQTELLNLIANDMVARDIEEMPRSTAQGATTRVLEVLRKEGVNS